jgi:hypothetical protein
MMRNAAGPNYLRALIAFTTREEGGFDYGKLCLIRLQNGLYYRSCLFSRIHRLGLDLGGLAGMIRCLIRHSLLLQMLDKGYRVRTNEKATCA